MAQVLRGDSAASGERYAIVVSRYNHAVTGKLLDGALQALRDAGVAEEGVCVAEVPGAWEIPVVTRRLAQTGQFAALICLGADQMNQSPGQRQPRTNRLGD